MYGMRRSNVKRKYKTPKAMLVDFHYDVQVKASSGNIATYGDPQEIGRCQQSSPTSCMVFWSSEVYCKMEPFSLR